MLHIFELIEALRAEIASIELRQAQGFHNPGKAERFEKRRMDLVITLATIKEFVGR